MKSAVLSLRVANCQVKGYPHGESNPGFRTENPTSWATRRWGRKPTIFVRTDQMRQRGSKNDRKRHKVACEKILSPGCRFPAGPIDYLVSAANGGTWLTAQRRKPIW